MEQTEFKSRVANLAVENMVVALRHGNFSLPEAMQITHAVSMMYANVLEESAKKSEELVVMQNEQEQDS